MEIRNKIFEDYQTLREESLQAMRNRNTILTFGLGVLGVIFHAGISAFSFESQDGFLISAFIFFFGIPALCILILLLWLGEAARMHRVSSYLKEREELINLLTGSVKDEIKVELDPKRKYPDHFDKLIFWENYIRERVSLNKSRQLLFPYVAVIILFFGMALISILISVFFPLRLLELGKNIEFLFLAIGVIVLLGVAIYIYKLSKKLGFIGKKNSS